jgi:small subunit ribosomal protein S1
MSKFSLDSNLLDLTREDFVDLFDQHLSQENIREQSVVPGKVLGVEGDHVLIDVSYKAEGAIPISEFRNELGEIEVEEGQIVDVYLDTMRESEGQLILSKSKADQMRAWDRIVNAYRNNEVVSGTITHRVKGGLSVNIGVKAFLPGSQVDLRPVKNLEKLIDQEFRFRIIKLNRRRGNIVLSRRVLLEEQRRSKREETLKKLEVGNVMNGVVKNITEYGAFIDLGGIDGLLHITDMTYGRLTDPSKIVQVGQEMQVKVLKFDAESQRVSLGYKQRFPDPWDSVEEKYPIDAIVRGEVVSITDYGIFVQLEEGIEGLVHISEISWNPRVKNPKKFMKVGDMVEAKIQEINTGERRISLSIRELAPDPWDSIAVRYPIGSIIRGQIRNIAEFGVFIGVEEGIDGLVHVSDLSWSQRQKKPADCYQRGQELEAKVINIDVSQRRFSLSVKDLVEDPWLSVQGRYFLGQILKGRVVSHTDFGIFVEIEDGVEGLVHSTELITSEGWAESYPISSEIYVEIRRIDGHDRRISLSEKGASDRESFSENVDEYIASQGDSAATVGDVFGDLSERMSKD